MWIVNENCSSFYIFFDSSFSFPFLFPSFAFWMWNHIILCKDHWNFLCVFCCCFGLWFFSSITFHVWDRFWFCFVCVLLCFYHFSTCVRCMVVHHCNLFENCLSAHRIINKVRSEKKIERWNFILNRTKKKKRNNIERRK